MRGRKLKRMVLIRISVGNGVELAMAIRIYFPLSKAASRKQEMGFLIDLRMSSGPWHGGYASTGAIRIYSGPRS